LEDVFGTTVHPQKLQSAGFAVECFAAHFNTDGKRPESSVKDPRIIRFCHQKRMLLVTTDKQVKFTHLEEIKKTTIGIIATESNQSGISAWTQALITAKPKIERLHKKQARPWFCHLSKLGHINNIETITENMKTRRTRPKEKEHIC
jgi:hypothetical protein